jgi:hypothetical protein
MRRWLPLPALSWFGADSSMMLIGSNIAVIGDAIAQSGLPAVRLECAGRWLDMDGGSHT